MAFSASPIASVRATGAAVTSITTGSIDTTGADLIIVQCCSAVDISAIDTCSDSKGNTWTAATYYGASNKNVVTWWCVPSSVGSGHTFTIGTGGAANIFGQVVVSAWSGAHASPLDQQNGNSSATQPGSITPTENDELIISGMASRDNIAYTIDSGFTIAQQAPFSAGNWDGAAQAYLVQGTAGAVNPTWNSTVASNQISFKAAAGGGSAFPWHHYQMLRRAA